MATNIDELVIRIKADTKQLNAALDKIKKKSKDTGNSGKKGFAGLTAQLGKLKGVAKLAGAAIVGIGAAIIPIAKVGMAFEDLQISLNTVFGGIRGGQDAFESVIDFAKTTPFQIEDVTKAFVRLKSAGLEPDIEMLKTFGDAASIAGNATEAFASLVKIASKATGGGLGLEELEQLETQGIAVYPILQKQLGLTRDKIAEFGKSTKGAALVIKALQKGLKETTGGTMSARMENLSTKVSNLEISFKQLALSIFEGGLGDMLKSLTDRMTGFVDSITAVIRAANLHGDIRQNTGKVFQRAVEDETAQTEGFSEFDRTGASNRLSAQGGIEGAAKTEIARIKNILDLVKKGVQPAFDQFNDVGLFNEAKKFVDMDEKEAVALLEGKIQFVDDYIKDREIAALKLKLEADPDNEDLKAQVDSIDIENAVVKAEGPLLKLLEAAKKAKFPLAEIDQAMADLILIKGKLGEDGKPILDEAEIQLVSDHLDMLKTKIEEAGKAEGLSKLTEEYGGLETAIAGVVDPIAEMEQTHRDLMSLFNSGDALAKSFVFGDMSEEEVLASIQRYKDSIADLNNPAKEVAKTLGDTLSQSVSNLAHQFTNNFVNALLDGKSALSSFKDFAKSMVSQIISIFLQMAVVNKILKAVFSGVNGGEGLNLDTLAGGGTYQKGQPTLVGERGPELMIPNTGGTVMNGMNTKNAMGGGSTIIVNQSLNFSTGVVGTVRAEINKMMPTIAEVSKSAVLDASRRGGNYRKGLLGA